MLAVVGIFIAMFFWRLLVLTGAAAFERAGLVPSAAVFEARSALTGVGYTTSEAEVVVNDPASRQAASLLMIELKLGVGTVGSAVKVGSFDEPGVSPFPHAPGKLPRDDPTGGMDESLRQYGRGR